MKWFVLFSIFLTVGCSAVIRTGPTQSARLVLEVEPGSADVVIDDTFVGTVESLDGFIDLRPGPRRVLIRAKGFEEERFDIDFRNGDEISLNLRMISAIDLPNEEPQDRKSILYNAKKRLEKQR